MLLGQRSVYSKVHPVFRLPLFEEPLSVLGRSARPHVGRGKAHREDVEVSPIVPSSSAKQPQAPIPF